jgi:membrane protease YdiL (CAAX protease family)
VRGTAILPGAAERGDTQSAAEALHEEPPRDAAAAEPPTLLGRLVAGYRLATADLPRELALGVGVGVAIWGAVLAILTAVVGLLQTLGGADWMPREASPLIVFLASQPLWLRLAAALSAGFFEETFFRGFLQPRVGVLFSTLLFTLAHWSYGEPFMLVGVALLSLAYAMLARWRRSVWAAVAAHATFDAVQLLVLLPWALKQAGALPPG